jgi:NAD(P)-dependent dehydrogenase (short-subunit alcohol dehydrogenase family)
VKILSFDFVIFLTDLPSHSLYNGQVTSKECSMNQFTIQDPRTQFPQPPFPKQPQDAPGLDKKMDPKPDHGEESYEGKNRLEGRKALITGGDSGIGRAVAIAFMREGADVAINYLEDEQADVDELKALFEAEGKQLICLPGDITDMGFTQKLVSDATERLGGLDALVLNAGKQTYVEDFDDLTPEQFDKTYKTNIYAPFWILKAASKSLQPGASVIITSSIQGYSPSPGLVDYASTKAAEKAFVQALAGQWIESKGVRVNAVAPGPVWTVLQPSGGQPQDMVEKFGSQVPLGRPAQPVELAPAYVFLTSQEASYVTGETYGVTGGEPTA